MAKSIGVGNSASNGLLAALLAEQGFEGPERPLEGPRGFLKVMGHEASLDVITRQLGEGWELAHNTYKPYPCGVVLNPVIEACLALHHEDAIRPDDVEHVELRGHPLLRQRTDRAVPSSGREAQVSAQHAVAVVLATGCAGLDEFDDASIERTRAFAKKVSFADDGSYSIESAAVKVKLRDGSQRSRHIANARGSLAAPLSDAELETKLRDLCEWGGSGVDPQRLIDAVWSLDTQADAGRVIELAAART